MDLEGRSEPVNDDTLDDCITRYCIDDTGNDLLIETDICIYSMQLDCWVARESAKSVERRESICTLMSVMGATVA